MTRGDFVLLIIMNFWQAHRDIYCSKRKQRLQWLFILYPLLKNPNHSTAPAQVSHHREWEEEGTLWTNNIEQDTTNMPQSKQGSSMSVCLHTYTHIHTYIYIHIYYMKIFSRKIQAIPNRVVWLYIVKLESGHTFLFVYIVQVRTVTRQNKCRTNIWFLFRHPIIHNNLVNINSLTNEKQTTAMKS